MAGQNRNCQTSLDHHNSKIRYLSYVRSSITFLQLSETFFKKALRWSESLSCSLLCLLCLLFFSLVLAIALLPLFSNPNVLHTSHILTPYSILLLLFPVVSPTTRTNRTNCATPRTVTIQRYTLDTATLSEKILRKDCR